MIPNHLHTTDHNHQYSLHTHQCLWNYECHKADYYVAMYIHTYVCISLCKKSWEAITDIWSRVSKINLNQKHPGCKKGVAKNQKACVKKEVKLKWAAKACVVLLLMEIKF